MSYLCYMLVEKGFRPNCEIYVKDVCFEEWIQFTCGMYFMHALFDCTWKMLRTCLLREGNQTFVNTNKVIMMAAMLKHDLLLEASASYLWWFFDICWPLDIEFDQRTFTFLIWMICMLHFSLQSYTFLMHMLRFYFLIYCKFLMNFL